jgi:hypothetical protein
MQPTLLFSLATVLAPLAVLARAPSPVLLVARATSSDTPDAPSTTTDTDTCDPAHNGLATGTLQYVSDCNATTFCQSGGTCAPKGCRRDEFPLGYPPSGVKANGWRLDTPDKCDNDKFCPDEGSSCQLLIAVGGACQLDRDGACAAPLSSSSSSASLTSRPHLRCVRRPGQLQGPPRRVGLWPQRQRLCLPQLCLHVCLLAPVSIADHSPSHRWANATIGNQCVVENVGYITYGSNSSEFVDIVSRYAPFSLSFLPT